MNSTWPLKPILLCRNVFSRHLHTAFNLCNLRKQGIIMNKLMNAKAKSKKKWYMPPDNTLPTVKNLSKTTHMTGKAGVRRMMMLNKLFMKNITDLLCTGSSSQEILGKGLEISKVCITPDFETVRVYWVCSSVEHGRDMEAALARTCGILRHELSQLRLMGEVPRIVFVKDEHSARLIEIDEKLAIADYGEDYEPKTLGHLLKTDFTVNTTLPPDVMAKIRQLELDCADVEDEPLPEMTHTIYGLDHRAMLSRMRGARKVSEEAWGRVADAGVTRTHNVVSYAVSDTPRPRAELDHQRHGLAEFLQKRQIEQDKLHKLAVSRQAERNVVFELDDDADEEEYVVNDDYEEETGYEEQDDGSPYHR